jgi:hypothetical protein
MGASVVSLTFLLFRSLSFYGVSYCFVVNDFALLFFQDYGLDFNDKDHQIQAFECRCGSSFCRGKVEDGKPWV